MTIRRQPARKAVHTHAKIMAEYNLYAYTPKMKINGGVCACHNMHFEIHLIC